ncbi:hypothetical protein B7R23_14950 [Subtercola boreus]|nr:hypothetical protein B7R24_14915 [Subtercola boreus]RFA18335.1 hypothetical protein B7R23_14950 [Subtercola boreus]
MPDEPLFEGEQRVGDDTVTIHRSPRYFRFMTAGAIVGLIIALVLTFVFPEPPGFNPAQIFGFLGLLFVVVGVAAGAVVALVIDRASRHGAKTIRVERIESAQGEADAAPAGQTTGDAEGRASTESRAE